eukprot:gene5594-biopygen3431
MSGSIAASAGEEVHDRPSYSTRLVSRVLRLSVKLVTALGGSGAAQMSPMVYTVRSTVTAPMFLEYTAMPVCSGASGRYTWPEMVSRPPSLKASMTVSSTKM